MSIPFVLRQPLKDLVHELVTENYTGLEADGRAGRLTAEALGRAVREYGRRLVDLPDDAFEVADAYAITGSTDCWAVDLTLWTADEQRSELTLSLTACVTAASVAIQIDDLHML